MRTVYLGTSEFAAGVLRRLAASPHRPALVVTRPDRPRGRGRQLQAPPVADAARELGIDLIQPETLGSEEVIARIEDTDPEALCVCAYGVLIREPLLSLRTIYNVHPSLLPRWRGAAPIERAIMAGDELTGVSIMRLTEGLDSGPVCLQREVPIGPREPAGELAARLERLGGDLLVEALDGRPSWTEQDEREVTYAAKIEAADRLIDHTLAPEVLARRVRALSPHIGARLPLPDGTSLGVRDAVALDDPPRALAGGRLRQDGARLLLDVRGGSVELLEVQPPGGRPMRAAEWLRGKPGGLDMVLDATLPAQDDAALLHAALREWDDADAWAPHTAALALRGTPEVRDRILGLVESQRDAERAVAARVLGQLGAPGRPFAEECAPVLEAMIRREWEHAVLAAQVAALGHLGGERGTALLIELAGHVDAEVRDAVAFALAGRQDRPSTRGLIALTEDRDARNRAWATFALARLSTDASGPLRDALADRSYDDDKLVRDAAIAGLRRRGDLRAAD